MVSIEHLKGSTLNTTNRIVHRTRMFIVLFGVDTVTRDRTSFHPEDTNPL